MNVVLPDQVENLPLVPVNVFLPIMRQPADAGDTHLVHPDKGTHVESVLIMLPVVNCIIAAGFEACLKDWV